MKVGKQVIAWGLIFALLIAFFPGTVLAVENTISLEEAVRIFKKNFEVPAEFSAFSSGYNQQAACQVWELIWQTEEEPQGHLRAQVDSKSGDILQMNFWSAEQKRGKLPLLSREEAAEIALNLVQTLQPKRLESMKLQENKEELLPLTPYAADTYNFQWVREVGGVPFYQDGINLSVNHQNGRVSNYSFHWTTGNFPSKEKVLSVKEAEQAWKKAAMLELQYFYPRYQKEDSREAKLVYRLVHPSGGILDAVSGEPLEQDKGLISYDLNRMKQMEVAVDTVLTPKEIKEIEAAGKVISQDEAVNVVREWVSVTEDFTLQNVYLRQDEQRAPGARTWSLFWSDEKEGRQRINADVDALNGELLSFSYYLPQEDQKMGKLDRAAAQKKAEEFLKKIQPVRFNEVKLNERQTMEPPRPLSKEELPLSQYFEYQRIVKGVVFPTNGITVSVNTLTGEIEAYHLNWQELKFPKPEGVLDLAEMNAFYLERQPLNLVYREIDKEIKLLYCPQPQPGLPIEVMSDAWTGEPLDWQGEPIIKAPVPLEFSDITNHWAEAEISLLGQAGFFGDKAPYFYPEKEISIGEFLRALLMLENGVHSVYTLTDQEIIKEAVKKGWLTEVVKPERELQRWQLARFCIHFLGLQKVAEIEGIYILPYTDEVPLAEQGYLALCWGLNLLKGSGDVFAGEKVAQRAEAAVALVRLLKCEL